MNAPMDAIARAPRARTGGRVVVFLTMAAALGVAALVFAMVVRVGLARREARLALTPDAALAGLRIPEFTLIDQHGREVTRASLLGRVTIVDFFFTHCPFVCPTMSANMLDLQRALARDGVRFLSVSVDPANDTPERMLAYATALGADLSSWTFARGEDEVVRSISEGGLTLGVADDPSRSVALGGGRSMNNIAHSSKFVLIGPDGSALAMASGLEAAALEPLKARARRAAAALAAR